MRSPRPFPCPGMKQNLVLRTHQDHTTGQMIFAPHRARPKIKKVSKKHSLLQQFSPQTVSLVAVPCTTPLLGQTPESGKLETCRENTQTAAICSHA